jgi:hypothetical protein
MCNVIWAHAAFSVSNEFYVCCYGLPFLHQCPFEVHFMLAQSLSQVLQAYAPDQVREFILGL